MKRRRGGQKQLVKSKENTSVDNPFDDSFLNGFDNPAPDTSAIGALDEELVEFKLRRSIEKYAFELMDQDPLLLWEKIDPSCPLIDAYSN